MKRKFVEICIIIMLLTFTMTCSAFAMRFGMSSNSKRKKGTPYREKQIEITQIESRKLDNDKSGLIWFTIKSKVRNKVKENIKLTLCLQAIDREGYELDEVCFYDQKIKKYKSRILSKKTVMDAGDYKNISKWKVDRVSIK